MENKYRIMAFRQDLAGFDEPKEGLLDGLQRINTYTKSGGIVGVFKHGSLENERKKVFFKYLQAYKNIASKKPFLVKSFAK